MSSSIRLGASRAFGAASASTGRGWPGRRRHRERYSLQPLKDAGGVRNPRPDLLKSNGTAAV